MKRKLIYVISASIAANCAIAAENLPITKTIKPGNQTVFNNEIHQKFCQSIGGVDITNDSTMILRGDATDAIACSIPKDMVLPGSIASVDNNNNISWSGNPIVTSSNLDSDNSWSVELYAPSGSIPFNTQAYVTGIANYIDCPSYFMENTTVAVPSDRCEATQSSRGGQTYNHQTVSVLCHAWVNGPVASNTNATYGPPNSPMQQNAFGTINQ